MTLDANTDGAACSALLCTYTTISCGQPTNGATNCPNNTDTCVFTPDPSGGSQRSCALTSQSDCDASLLLDAQSDACRALGCTYSRSESADVIATTEFPMGRTTVVLIAADEATPPNTDTCSVVVTVEDDQAPVIMRPGDVQESRLKGKRTQRLETVLH